MLERILNGIHGEFPKEAMEKSRKEFLEESWMEPLKKLVEESWKCLPKESQKNSEKITVMRLLHSDMFSIKDKFQNYTNLKKRWIYDLLSFGDTWVLGSILHMYFSDYNIKLAHVTNITNITISSYDSICVNDRSNNIDLNMCLHLRIQPTFDIQNTSPLWKELRIISCQIEQIKFIVCWAMADMILK